MNIFNKYGIKEVADVVFYSITRIGDEEFYTPVLFFDTLKVSALTKSVETVNAKGGKANGKLLSWNFESDSKLKLEDALFSEMSLNMFMNGRVMAKLSDWTSLIAKLNVANKYGQKNYSVMAYQSPLLTEKEKEILFRCAQKAGFNSKDGTYIEESMEINSHSSKYVYDSISRDSTEDTYVAENRKVLLENYYKRKQPTPYPRDLAAYVDFNNQDYGGVQILIELSSQELNNTKTLKNLQTGQEVVIFRDLEILFINNTESYSIKRFFGDRCLLCKIKKTTLGYECEVGAINTIAFQDENGNRLPENFFSYSRDGGWLDIGNEFFLSHVPYFLFPRYLENLISNLCYCDQRDKSQLAMPQKIIDEIAEEINNFSKIGRFENDLYEIDIIDRFEKCIVNKKQGQKIDLTQQLINLKKQYNNEKDNYTVFYDEKTMLPFLMDKFCSEKIYQQKRVEITAPFDENKVLIEIKKYFKNIMSQEWIDSLTNDDYKIITTTPIFNDNIITKYFVNFKITKHEYLIIKYGTVYYKWSRTINTDSSNMTFIGTDLNIDVDTFPGEYMIVGETYIREQKTGKDQRYQFVINRAAISPQTKIQLQAGGDPTTFSIDIDLLVPKIDKKSMLELRQYNVEEDKQDGGYSIIPQNKKHSYTPAIQAYSEIIIENNEIY